MFNITIIILLHCYKTCYTDHYNVRADLTRHGAFYAEHFQTSFNEHVRVASTVHRIVYMCVCVSVCICLPISHVYIYIYMGTRVSANTFVTDATAAAAVATELYYNNLCTFFVKT